MRRASPPGQPRRTRRLPDLSLTLPQRKVDPSDFVIPVPQESAPAAEDAAAEPPPEELERVRRLGSWAGGTVWMVRHRISGRPYALKVLDEKPDQAVRRQLAREVAILHTVEHPAVVRCHGLYDLEGELQILFEYMDGGSLHGRRIEDEQLLSHVAQQALSGIDYLHGRQIVHREIKPSNLLTDAGHRVKIANFGLGRILNHTMDSGGSSMDAIAYMSPERINTHLNAYDGYTSDIWSFGMTILELYMGTFPFGENLYEQGDWTALLDTICYSDPPELPLTASREFRNFIRCCLQKDPANRSTATSLLQHPFVAGPQPPTVLPRSPCSSQPEQYHPFPSTADSSGDGHLVGASFGPISRLLDSSTPIDVDKTAGGGEDHLI